MLRKHSEGDTAFSLGPLRSEQKLPMQTCEGQRMSKGAEGLHTQESRSFGMAGCGPRTAREDLKWHRRDYGYHAERCGQQWAPDNQQRIRRERMRPAKKTRAKDEIKSY